MSDSDGISCHDHFIVAVIFLNMFLDQFCVSFSILFSLISSICINDVIASPEILSEASRWSCASSGGVSAGETINDDSSEKIAI